MKQLVAIILSVLVLSIQQAHCNEPEWWENGVFYQIYPRSFKDSNGDGIGDLRGIIDNLDHLKDLGVTGAWLNPVFMSPMKDGGYDIQDYFQVDPIFGTNEDLEELFAKAKELGLKIILDMVPNHTSDQHEWFLRSLNSVPGYEDFYVWLNCPLNDDGITRRFPNNWISVYHTLAWTYSPQRDQCYLHQFTREQPDLNYRNPRVHEEMMNVFRYWLEKGADGFRMQAVNHLYEVENFSNERIVNINGDRTSRANLIIEQSMNQPQSYDFIYDVRRMMDNFSAEAEDKHTRVLMTDAYANIAQQLPWYGTAEDNKGAHWPSNYIFLSKLDRDSTAHDFKNATTDWVDGMPPWGKPNWILGNHDTSRVGFRYVENRHESLAIMSLMLPGPSFIYYGEEILMTDHRGITFEESDDPHVRQTNSTVFMQFSRDPARTPFQWDDTDWAGFSNTTGRTWLPLHPDYKTRNLKAQKEADKSTFKLYQKVIRLRNNNRVLQDGGLITKAVSDQIFGFMRTLAHHHTIVVLVNLRGETKVNLKDLMDDEFSDRVRARIMIVDNNSTLIEGSVVGNVREIEIGAFETLVLEISSATKSAFATLLLFVSLLRYAF